jgi:hypothetical protein
MSRLVSDCHVNRTVDGTVTSVTKNKVEKTTSIKFKGRDPVRTEIITDNKIIEEVKFFNYLGNVISYKNSWTLTTNYKTI